MEIFKDFIDKTIWNKSLSSLFLELCTWIRPCWHPCLSTRSSLGFIWKFGTPTRFSSGFPLTRTWKLTSFSSSTCRDLSAICKCFTSYKYSYLSRWNWILEFVFFVIYKHVRMCALNISCFILIWTKRLN